MSADTATASLTAAAEQVRTGALTATELLDSVLDRDRALPVEHRCYVRFDPTATAHARDVDSRVRAGLPVGSLAGVPIGVKDNISVAGMPISAGSASWHTVPAEDAEVVRRLRAAGAVIVGTHVMHERALGLDAPPVRNAYDRHRHPGGSTAGGGVSVALGTALAAIGTDTGGSVRLPAAVNGCVGLKPTTGRVSRHGVLPPSTSLDHVGIITRTVTDAAAVLEVIAGHRAGDETSAFRGAPAFTTDLAAPVPTPRVGVPARWTRDLRDDVAVSLDDILRRLESVGAHLIEVDLMPDPSVFAAWDLIGQAESYSQVAEALAAGGGGFTPRVRSALAQGAVVGGSALVAAHVRRERWRTEVDDSFAELELDALVTPASPIPALRMDELVPERDLAQYCRFLAPFSVSGNPGITLPAGLSREGSPLGAQLVGPHFGEGDLLRIARMLEATQ